MVFTDLFNSGTNGQDLALTTLTSGSDFAGWNLSSDWGGRLSFGVTGSAYNTTPNEHLSIVSGGNVGIGTTTPAQKLSVAGNINLTSYGNFAIPTGNALGRVTGQYGLFGANDSLLLSDNYNRVTGTVDHASLGTAEIELRGGNPQEGAIYLRTGATNTAPADVMTIINGRVGIGVTDPQYKLDISGRLRIGTITDNNGNSLCEAGGVVQHCASLRRLKEQIRDLDLPGVETVQGLRPVDFVWKSDDSAGVGFIAEEVADVDMRLAESDEHGLIGVKYGSLTAVLVKAIQEQQRQIEDLRGEIESLKVRVAQPR